MTGAKVEELLPCPFCGTSAILMNRHNKIFWVQCQWVEGCLATQINATTPEEAIKAWNTRPSNDRKCGKLADDYVGKCPECEKFGHIKMRCDKCSVQPTFLGPLDDSEKLGNIIKCYCTNSLQIDFSTYGAEKLAEYIISKLGKSPAPVPSVNNIESIMNKYLKVSVWLEDQGGNGHGVTSPFIKPKTINKCAQAIHDLLTGGNK